MKTKIKEVNSYTRVLSIEVKWDDLKSDYIKEYKKNKSQFSIPGFRKGKVPDHIVKQNIGHSVDNQFADNSINTYYRKALEELKITPINQGKVNNLTFSEGNDLQFDIEFEVVPAFKLPSYKKKSKIKTQKFIANSKDVEESLSNLQQQQAKGKPVEGKIKKTNFVYADFTRIDQDGNEVKDSTLKNHYIKIGEGLFTGKLEKKFIGKSVNDVFKVDIEQDSGIVKYSVKVNKIEEQILPELNDDFAKTVDPNIKNIKDLKSQLLENIQSKLDHENKKEFDYKIVDFFVDKTKLEPPQTFIDSYKKHLIEQYKKDFESKGQQYDINELEKNADLSSKKMVKWQLIKQEILKEEKLVVTSDDIEKYIKNICEKNPTQKKEILKYYQNEENKNKLYQDLIDENLFKNFDQYFINDIKEKSTDSIRKKRK